MKLLLDTHIWLWSLLDRQRLSSRVIAELEDSNNEVWVSPISTWEILLLAQKKRISLDEDAAPWIAHKLSSVPVREAPVTHEVVLETSRTSIPHRHPADHFLVATAKVFGLTLVTSDEKLFKTRGISVLKNRV